MSQPADSHYNLIELTDIHDPRLDLFRSMKLTNSTRDLPHFVVEGSLLVERLLQSRFETACILTHREKLDHCPFSIPESVPRYLVPRQFMTDLVGFSFHQGILACGVRKEWPSLSELLHFNKIRTIVICPAIDNPENLGSIARTAEALGVGAIIVGKESPDPLSRRLTRVSMGATLKLPILKYENVHEALDELQTNGFQFVATLPGNDCIELDAFTRPENCGLLLGREREGLAEEFIRRANHRVTISMIPGADSLNVSVAAGIFLYHFSRSKPD
jgi:tRNA G18 (ribose-2'-O)-methylase SpoU